MDSRDGAVQRIPVKRGRPPKPKLKVEKILIKEEDYQYDSEENESAPNTKFAKSSRTSENERADSVKSNSNSSRSITILPSSLAQFANLSDEESDDEEIMSVLGTKELGGPSKPTYSSSVSRRGSVASRTRMTAVGKRRSKRLKKPVLVKKEGTADEKTKVPQHNQGPKRGRPQKCVVALEKLSVPRLPSVVGQGVEINVDSESEASSDAGSYTHFYNKRRLNPPSSGSSKADEDSDDNRSYLGLKTEHDDSDPDATSDNDECLGGKRIRAAAAAAMEVVAKKRFESLTDKDRERAERRNRKPYIKPYVPKGRSRRTIVFKRGSQKPTRGVDSNRYLTFMNSTVHKGVYFQEGDIVFILGKDDRPYYCQIRHIARDWNHEPVCGLLWLTPKAGTKGPFNPANFDIRDDLPEHTRKFDYVNFVMHCPLDYWYGHESSYFHPLPGTVYQRLGEPLVEVVQLPPKTSKPPKSEKETEKENVGLNSNEGDAVKVSPDRNTGAETCDIVKIEKGCESDLLEKELSDVEVISNAECVNVIEVESDIDMELDGNSEPNQKLELLAEVKEEPNTDILKTSVENLDGDPNESLDGDPNESLDGDPIESLDGDPIESLDGDPIEDPEGDSIEDPEDDDNENPDEDHNETYDGDPIESPDAEHNESYDDDHNENPDVDHNESYDADPIESPDADHNESYDDDHNESYDYDGDHNESYDADPIESPDGDSNENPDNNERYGDLIEIPDDDPIETLDLDPIESMDAEPIESPDGESIESPNVYPNESLDADRIEIPDSDPNESLDGDPIESPDVYPNESLDGDPIESIDADADPIDAIEIPDDDPIEILDYDPIERHDDGDPPKSPEGSLYEEISDSSDFENSLLDD